MFFNSRKKKPEPPPSPPTEAPFSLAESIVKGMRERRKHIRVRYPDVGAVGDLPVIEINSVTTPPLNLSQGGMLADLPGLKLILGEEHPIKIIWKYGPLVFNHVGQLLRQNGNHCHFKFTKVDIRSFAEFSKSFNAGIQGAGTHLAKEGEAPAYLLEFWKSAGPDKILFQKTSNGEVADIFLAGFRITFHEERGLLREEQDASGQWGLRPARTEIIDEVLIFLTNIVEPSSRLQSLLHRIIKKHYPTAPALKG